MNEQLIANDLKDVFHRAKGMGCKRVKAFYDVPIENVKIAIKALEEVQKYRKLGTVEELREAKEKQIPKKVELWNGQDCCPNCNKLFGQRDTRKRLLHWKMDYCNDCGQKLDWSE